MRCTAMRLVRFDTGSTDDANEASRAGMMPMPTGSMPRCSAMRTYKGVSSTTAASRLKMIVTPAASIHSAATRCRPPSNIAATAAKKPVSSSNTANGTASAKNSNAGPRSSSASVATVCGTMPITTAALAMSTVRHHDGMRRTPTSAAALAASSTTIRTAPTRRRW